MTDQLTALEITLQNIVAEADPVKRADLADRYAAELRLTIRSISSRTQSVIWSEKDDILEQVGQVNVLVSRTLAALQDHSIESRMYREAAAMALQTATEKLNTYIAALPPEERARLIAQIADHELRITALENDADGDKS
jgi:hypothetical protein